jgi:EAL domain-containing protein (putative c-di-GMP-specific phosphodiesterase class I)
VQTHKSAEIGPDEIRSALIAGQFLPHYQPKIDLLSGKIVGAEALARWKNELGDIVSPAKFIPIAEKHGLIDEISMQILKLVTHDIKNGGPAWSNKKISVNLTARMVQNSKLPEMVEKVLLDGGIHPDAICIEITESGIIDIDPTTIEVLSRLRMKGFDLSIDDFGTGAANIANLKAFPYNELKIDQSYINNVLTDAFSAETVRTSISLARQMNLRIVAEGIETKDVLQFAKSKGIDQAQGFFFSKALPAEQVSALFDSPLSWITKNAELTKSNAA